MVYIRILRITLTFLSPTVLREVFEAHLRRKENKALIYDTQQQSTLMNVNKHTDVYKQNLLY